MRVGTAKPLRVQIRFVDDVYEGKQDWVPPARLKVTWSDIDSWLAREQRWEAVRSASWHVSDTPENWAAEYVLSELGDLGVELGFNQNVGVLMASDVNSLAEKIGLSVSELTEEPLAFFDDDGTYVAPWSTAHKVVLLAAPLVADKVLAYVRREEDKKRDRAMHGEYYEFRKGESHFIPAEQCAEIDARWQPSYELAREWCGAEPRRRFDELVALREEVARIGGIAERAIRSLEAAGDQRKANELKRELGIPLDQLRASSKKLDQ